MTDEVLTLQFGISVIMVHLFHISKRWFPWIEKQTDHALRVVSWVVAILSGNLVTFAIQRNAEAGGLRMIIDIPALLTIVRLLINVAVQHGASQLYYFNVIRRYSQTVTGQSAMSAPKPAVAGPILSLPNPIIKPPT